MLIPGLAKEKEAGQCEGSEGALSGLPGSCVLQQGIEQDSVVIEAGEGKINWMSGVIGPLSPGLHQSLSILAKSRA